MTEEEIEHELLELEIYRDGLDYEWSKKPFIIRAILKIQWFLCDLWWIIREKLFPPEDPPF